MSVASVAARQMPVFQALAFLAAFLGIVWTVLKHFGIVGAPAVPQS